MTMTHDTLLQEIATGEGMPERPPRTRTYRVTLEWDFDAEDAEDAVGQVCDFCFDMQETLSWRNGCMQSLRELTA